MQQLQRVIDDLKAIMLDNRTGRLGRVGKVFLVRVTKESLSEEMADESQVQTWGVECFRQGKPC